MAPSQVQTLIGAVRRHLWAAQFAGAIRLAAWCSAAWMLLAAALQLTTGQVPIGAAIGALVVTWASMLAHAGWRRPADPGCALWADRHLGGASAYTTMLDLDRTPPGQRSAQAERWLEQWTAARVPDSLRLLSGRHESARLARPILSMLVCAALAVLVLRLPGAAPSSRPAVAVASSSPSGLSESPTALAEAPVPAQLVNEITQALRTAESRDAAEGGGTGRAAGAGPAGKGGDIVPSVAGPGVAVRGEAAASGPSRPGTAVDAAAKAGASRTSGGDSGHQAGDSRDERGELGVSPALRGTKNVQRSGIEARHPATERQADMDRLASYDDGIAMRGAAAMRGDAPVAAATPPPVTEAARLSRTETSYVQAWMKASGQHR